MNKKEFFRQLNFLLKSLPQSERNKTADYYTEIIEDYIENGSTEAEAIARLGNIDNIAEEILKENAPQVTKPKMATSSKVLMGILLFLGFPIWGSLALGAGCILLAFNILIVTPIIICGSMVLATLLTSIASIVTSFILMFDSFSSGLFQLGAGIAIAGICGLLTILLFYIIRWISALFKSEGKMLKRIFKKGGVSYEK